MECGVLHTFVLFVQQVQLPPEEDGKGSKNSYPEYIFATKDPNFTLSLDKMQEISDELGLMYNSNNIMSVTE